MHVENTWYSFDRCNMQVRGLLAQRKSGRNEVNTPSNTLQVFLGLGATLALSLTKRNKFTVAFCAAGGDYSNQFVILARRRGNGLMP